MSNKKNDLKIRNWQRVMDSIRSGSKKVSHIIRDARITTKDVYSALEVLMGISLVETYDATDDKRVNVYYRLTPEGTKIKSLDGLEYLFIKNPKS